MCSYASCFRDNSLDYLEFRLWIGLWSAVFCLVLVATDASFLVQYFTRFTEEGFSALISFIFIYDAFKKMLKLSHHNPINPNYSADLVTLYRYDCNCAPGKTSRSNPIWTVEIPLWTLSAFTSVSLGLMLFSLPGNSSEPYGVYPWSNDTDVVRRFETFLAATLPLPRTHN